MINAGMMSSATDLWSTPQDFFEELNDEFWFTLDVCATPQNAKCRLYFTQEDDGLAQPWTGHAAVWMNPPYGREIGKWVAKARQEQMKGVTVVGLLPARTDTAWFQNCVLPFAELRWVRGRLKFGGSKNSAPFPSVVAIYRGAK